MPDDLEKSKKLKFRSFKARKILAGEKTSSVRLFDDKNLSVGDKLELVDSESGETFARAIIEDVVAKNLGEITKDDLLGHERWDTVEAMLESFRGHYGDQVTLGTPAKIIRFKLHD